VNIFAKQELGRQEGSQAGAWEPGLESRTKAIGTDAPSHSLTLIGTVHGDPRGYARALALLDHLGPDVVSVEISPFSLRYRLRHGTGWRRRLARGLGHLPRGAASHLALQRLAAQVDLPFEVQAARDYHRRTGAPWRPLDLGFVARRHLPRFGPELLAPGNLQALLATQDGDLAEYVAGEYHRARLALARPPRRPIFPGNPETRRRERLLARRLRRLASRYPRVAHLGGWEHLVPWQDCPGLVNELADLRPRRLLLDEADRAPGWPTG
jgi:hypothetical protein